MASVLSAASAAPNYIVSYLSRCDSRVVHPGAKLPVSWATANIGEGDASVTSHTAIYLSADTTFDPGMDFLFIDTEVPPLVAGSSLEVLCEDLTVPEGVPPGTYYLLGVADLTSVIEETCETDNVTVGPTVHLQAKPVVTLSLTGVGEGSVLVDGAPHTLPFSGPVDANSPVLLAAIPAEGWVFSHWSGDVVSSENPIEISITEDTSIVVNFTQVTYQLSVAMVGEGSISVNGTPHDAPFAEQVAAGSEVTLAATPAPGWAFAGWSGALTGTMSPTTLTVDTDVLVVATFTQATYLLTVNGVGEGIVEVNGAEHPLPWSGLVAAGSEVILEAEPAEGWQFDNWSGALTGSDNRTTVTMDSDKTVTANFSQILRTIVVNIVGQGSVSVNGTPQTPPISVQVPTGSQVTLLATPAAGWRFAGWSGDVCGPANPLTFTVTDDRTITATFEQITHAVRIEKVGEGSVLVDGMPQALPFTETVAEGTSLTLQAVPAAGWIFANWTGTVTGPANPLTLVVSSDVSVTANFTQVFFTLTLTGNRCGFVEVNGGAPLALPASEELPAETVATLTAVPRTSHRLDAWSGDVTGADTVVELLMNSDKTVNARFVLDLIDINPSFWAYQDIHAAVDADIVRGYPDRTYRPDFEVGRDQMAVYIARGLAGGDTHVPSGPVSPAFPDVPADSWAFRYIEFCFAHDVVVGYPNGTYLPSKTVDRGQMAVYVSRSIANPTGDTGLATFSAPTTPSFPDAIPSLWAYRYVEFAKARGVVHGYPDGSYRPEKAVTRDQMAVYVRRAFRLEPFS